MDNGGDSFKVEHKPDAAEITIVHEAEAREIGHAVRDKECGQR